MMTDRPPASTDTRIGGYIIRHAAGTWNLYLASTGEHLRAYTSHHGACIAAERYERLTANLREIGGLS